GEIQYEDALIRKKGRNLAVDDALSEAFNNCCFSDSRIADEHGIVLGAAPQNLNDTIDFVVAADERVEHSVHSRLGEITREFTEKRRFLRFDECLAIDNRAS